MSRYSMIRAKSKTERSHADWSPRWSHSFACPVGKVPRAGHFVGLWVGLWLCGFVGLWLCGVVGLLWWGCGVVVVAGLWGCGVLVVVVGLWGCGCGVNKKTRFPLENTQVPHLYSAGCPPRILSTKTTYQQRKSCWTR